MRGLFIITSVLLPFLLCNANQHPGATDQPARRHFHIIASSNEEIELIVPETRIALQADSRALSAETLRNLICSGGSAHVFLLVYDQFAETAPGVLYHLYFDLPANEKPGKEDTHYVGALNFYGRTGVASGGNSFVSYDITALIKSLTESNRLTPATTLSIVPSGSPFPAAKPRIGRIELATE